MKRDEATDKLIVQLSKQLGISMEAVETVISSYKSHLLEHVNLQSRWSEQAEITMAGFEGIPIVRGLTLVYGNSDVGKTALCCGIAQRCATEGYTVAFLDSELKMTKAVRKKALAGHRIAYAQEYIDSGLKEAIMTGLVNVLVVDSITALYASAQLPFLKRVLSYVPYVIATAQMRSDIRKGRLRLIPAVQDEVAALVHTKLLLTEREQIAIEGDIVHRVQYVVEKCVVPEVKRKSGSFIIRKGTYDEVYTIYDKLRSSGKITIQGHRKILKAKSGDIILGKLSCLTNEVFDEMVATYKETRGEHGERHTEDSL